MDEKQDPEDEKHDDKQVSIGDKTDIGTISGGTVAVGREATAIGTLIERMEERNIAGDYIERQEISNTILIVGSEGLDELTEWLTDQQGVNLQVVRQPGAQPPAENSDRQIRELVAAQRETAAQGISASPQASYRLGMLAAYRRDYDAAITYFQEAGSADLEYSDAFEAVAWLQQSLAMDLIKKQDYDSALDRLAKARTAAANTDPLDANALALRGYIAKTLAQIAEARQDPAGREKYYEEAARLFEHIVALDPENPSAHNGLANVYYAAGDNDSAVSASKKAIALAPNYTAAYHDLALAYEAKWREEPQQGAKWCAQAIAAWREAYRLAPDDPAFTADKILQIGQRIRQLEGYCS